MNFLLRYGFILLFCLGNVSLLKPQSDKVIEQKEDAARKAHKDNDYEKEAKLLREIGDIYFKRKQFHDAYKSYDDESEAWDDFGDKKKQAIAIIYASSALQKEEKYSKSIRFLERSLEIGLKLKDKNIIGTCYGMLSKGYRETGDEIKATEYYTNFENLAAHVENEELKQEIVKSKKVIKDVSTELESTEEVLEETTENLIETEKSLKETEAIAYARKLEIDMLNKEKRIHQLLIDKQNAEIRNERLIRNMVIFGLLLVGILAVILFISYRNKRRDNRIINDQKEKIVDSINYAHKIQQALLPNLEVVKSHFFDFFNYYRPQGIVSGDFYFFTELKDSYLVSVVDCTGHGVPGAIMSVIGHNALSEIIQSGVQEVNLILDQLHNRVVKTLQQDSRSNKDGMDISLCKIYKDMKKIEFAGARNALYYIEKNEAIKKLDADRRPVGGVYRRKLRDFNKQTLDIKKDTFIYLMTDGYSDQFNSEKKKFHMVRLSKILEENCHLPGKEQCTILDEELRGWQGTANQTDDICVMGIQISPK